MKKFVNGIVGFFRENPVFVVVLLLAIGATFRIIYPGHVGVGFDQVQVLTNANGVLHGDWALIGPRTGPANIFTGPLIYYITAPFIWAFGDTWSVALVPMFISLVTGVTLYLMMKRYVGNKEALLTLLLWSFSHFLIRLDRIFWNPDLTLLSATLLFIPLLKEKNDKTTFIAFLAGAFLSWQAHFSGLLLVGLATLSIFYLRRPLKYVFTMMFGLLVSLAPTAIFDVRNNYLNLRGLLELFSSKHEFNAFKLAQDITHNFYVVIETFGKVFLHENITETIVAVGLVLLIASVLTWKSNKHVRLSVLWIVALAVSYGLYSGPKPEYYFLIILPALLFLSVHLFARLPNTLLFAFLSIFVLSNARISLLILAKDQEFSAGKLDRVRALVRTFPVKEIAYDMPYGSDFGVKYYLSEIQKVDDGKIVHVTYPNNYSFSGIKNIKDVAVWVDPRTEDKNYLTTPGYILSTNKNVMLLQNQSLSDELREVDVYSIVEGNVVIGDMSVAKKDVVDSTKSKVCESVGDHFAWSDKLSSYLYSAPSHCIQMFIDKAALERIGLGII